MDDDELMAREDADDMVLNAEHRIGGALGVGTPVGLAYARGRGWTGPSGCLSAKGLAHCRALRKEKGWDR
jgi:hypothetical protein